MAIVRLSRRRWWAHAAPATIALIGCGSEPLDTAPADIATRRTAIIGGANSSLGQWPWNARIETWQLCGGSLIAPDWVLTAGHCLLDQSGSLESPGNFTLYFGDISRSQNESPSEWVSGVDAIKLDPDYTLVGNSAHHDFGLLHLTSPPPPLAANIRTVRPAAGNDAPGLNAAVYGWGRTSAGGALSDVLKHVTVPIVANATCDADPTLSRNLLPDEQCMGSNDGNPGTCQGDSGSGYAVERTPGAWEIVGVVSWGGPNCNGHEVAARVSTHGDFIRKHVFDAAMVPALGSPLL